MHACLLVENLDEEGLLPEFKALLRQLDRLEDDSVKKLFRLLAEARSDLRQRVLALPDESATIAIINRMEQAVTEAANRLAQSLVSSLLGDVRAAFGLGVQLADVTLPSAATQMRFMLPDFLVQQVGNYHANLVTDLSDTLRGQVTRQIQLGVLAGKPSQEIVKDIGAAGLKPTGPFKTAEERADAIARTELNRIPNLAENERLKDAGKIVVGLEKRWLTAGDIRVRPTHVAANKQTVPVDGKFIVGGFKCEHPLDPVLPAKEAIKCRCRMVAVLPEETK